MFEIVDQGSAVTPPPKRRVVPEHTRTVGKAKEEGEVPIQSIELPVPEALANEAYERIGQRITFRLAPAPRRLRGAEVHPSTGSS